MKNAKNENDAETLFDGALEELLPPHMQALAGRRLNLTKVKKGNFEFTVAANCWTTPYELTRLRLSQGTDFNVFYTDTDVMEARFNNPALFGLVGTKMRTEEDAIVDTAQVDDILNFFEADFVHSAIVVAPGLVFEKQGPTSDALYRLRTLHGVLLDWPGVNSIKILRPTGALLPHPLSFADGPMGGNTITYSNGWEFALVAPLPPLVPWKGAKQERWQLPPLAFDTGTFVPTDAPGSPLDLSIIWRVPFDKTCTLKRDAQAKSLPWKPGVELGLVSAGTQFVATQRSFDFVEAAVVTTVDGLLLSGRALKPAWFALSELDCL